MAMTTTSAAATLGSNHTEPSRNPGGINICAAIAMSTANDTAVRCSMGTAELGSLTDMFGHSRDTFPGFPAYPTQWVGASQVHIQ
ncbi:MAG: hypothetical protein EBU85_06170 [Actinobacteria bacterium]|nr:hypothetical protein [Actinomycetota bacterium]